MGLGHREHEELVQECARLRVSRDSLQALVDDLRREAADDVVDLRAGQAEAGLDRSSATR